MLEMNLRTRSRQPRRAVLREPTGADELFVSRADSSVATELLSRLLVESPEATVLPQHASRLSVGDRDRLIAGLQAQLFSDIVESRLACGSCGIPFSFSFSLSALVAEIERDAEETAQTLDLNGPDDDGVYQLAQGTRFRLPSVEDERFVRALDGERRAEALFQRCCLSDSAEVSSQQRQELESALMALSPLIALPMPTRCVTCGTEQEADFDVVQHFLGMLTRERPLVAREIHTLARAYGWSFDEISRLPRSLRHTHVELIEAERGNWEAQA